jgi:hypothetical protein
MVFVHFTKQSSAVSAPRSGLAGDGVGQVQAGACGATDGTWGQGCRSWEIVVEAAAAMHDARARTRWEARPWDRFREKHWSALCWGVEVWWV